MSKWMFTLNIKDEFKKANELEDKESNIALLNKIISELKLIFDNNSDEYILGLIEEFSELKADLDNDFFESIQEFQSEFNYIFDDLYDWADISLDGKFGGKKNCWIKTF